MAIETVALLFAVTGFLTFVGVVLFIWWQIYKLQKMQWEDHKRFLSDVDSRKSQFNAEFDHWRQQTDKYIQNTLEIFGNQISNRWDLTNQIFSDQKHRLDARDKEIDLVIADIPKRINEAIAVAQAKFSEPYKQMQDELDKKGVEKIIDSDPIDIDFDMEAKLDRALREYGLTEPTLDER